MPLVIPEWYERFKMVAIDPGVNTTGVSVFDIETRTGKILNIEAQTLTNSKLANMTGLDPDIVPERTIKLFKLRDAIVYILNFVRPTVVACEAPFYNSLMPMAYGSLMEVTGMVHQSVLAYNSNTPFHLLAPQLVKKSLGVAGKKGKEVVMEAVKNRPDLIQVLSTPLETLDEHSIDSIGVGDALLRYRLYPKE